jgi:hypothetical protein
VPAPPAPLVADLESTAELPVLDPAGEPPEQAALSAPDAQADAHHTETWVMPHPAHVPRVLPADPPAADELRARPETSLPAALGQLRDMQELLAAKEERAAQLEDALQEAHEIVQRQLEQLRAGHEQLAAALTQQRVELDAAQHAARAAAEQRSNELSDELARTHALLSALTVRATQLQQELDIRAAEARAHQSAALERRQALVASERAHAATLRELNAERERNALCLESLHRTESRRQILHSVVADLQREIDGHETSLARLGNELVSRDARAREQDGELIRRDAHILRLEQQAGNAPARREQQLPVPVAADPAELARLQAECTQLAAASAAARTESAAALAAERHRAGLLESELAGVRQEMTDWAGVLQAAQLERSERTRAAAAAEARLRDLEQRLAEHSEAQLPQAQSNASVARVRELEADLRAAEDTINRLESEVRGRGARLEDLEKANRQWRLTMEEVRASSTDSGAANSALRAAAAPHEAPGPGHDPVPEGATRLLICRQGGSDLVHVLGRKTSVGRTPDNDLQIDAKYISRHHAVILAGPVHTVIEDLNSTNGVLVNGQRVTRQILKDGDEVVIGRSQYRFAVRRGGEKH